MMASDADADQRIKDAMRSLAALGADDPLRVRTVLARGRRLRRRRRLGTLVGGVVVVASVALAAILALPAGGKDQTVLSSSPYAAGGPGSPSGGVGLDWTPRGRYAEDSGFLRQTTALWDRSTSVIPEAPRGAHTGVRILYAEYSELLGAVAVLQGADASGHLRLAILTGPYRHAPRPAPAAQAAADELVLRDDRPAPPTDAAEVSLLTRHLPAAVAYRGDPYIQDPTLGDRVLGLAFAQPDATVRGFTSTSFDSYSDGHSPASPWHAMIMPPAATLANVTLTVDHDGKAIYTGPPDGTGLADPTTPPGGTIEGLAVAYLPPGFRPTAAPTAQTSQGVTHTTGTYRDSSSTTIQITASRGREARPSTPPGATVSPTTTHGGKDAQLIMSADGTDTVTWQETPDLVLAITGPHARQIDLYNIGHALTPTQK